MSNVNSSDNNKVIIEKLQALKALLKGECSFIDYGSVLCQMPIKKILKLKDEDCALANIEDAFNQIATQLSLEDKEFDEIDLEIMFNLFFTKNKNGYYRGTSMKDIVLVDICNYAFSKDNENHEEKIDMRKIYPMVPVSFNKMLNLLKKRGYTVDFESFDDLVQAFAKDKPMCTRIRKSYTEDYPKQKRYE